MHKLACLPNTAGLDLEKELMTPTEPDGVDPRGRWLLNEKEKAALEKAEMLTGTPDNKGRPILVASLLSHKLYYMYERGWINGTALLSDSRSVCQHKCSLHGHCCCDTML